MTGYGNLSQLPERIQAALYQAFDLQLLYNKDMHQVTIWVTITDSTPTPSPPSSRRGPRPRTGNHQPDPSPDRTSPTTRATSALTQRPMEP